MNEPDFSALTPQNIVAFIGDIFERRGAEEYLGEPVTIAEHMLQGATMAEQSGQDEMIVAAVLLHDIGHFVSEFGSFQMDDTEDRYHEVAGAKVLARFFPALITDCVRHHVTAKRYLCATNPDYAKRLSDASIHSLKLQGGPLNPEEVAAFEANPYVEEIIQVRCLDDAGKRTDMTTLPYSHFAPMIQRIVDAHCGAGA
ncbi:MAG: (R)-1-hydroxy-2-trimethylaminoethylphosphonate oxygenase [Alphaproteobacteria bacterium]